MHDWRTIWFSNFWLKNVQMGNAALETESNKSDGPALTSRSAPATIFSAVFASSSS